MKRRLTAAAAVLCLILCTGCGSIFDKEYVYMEEYSFSDQNAKREEEEAIASLSELKSAILDIVNQGETERRLRVSEKYSGNIEEDMQNACWQVRSQEALCAYCVKNISYDINQILSYSEALVRVDYYPNAVPVSEIHRLQYSTGLEDIISTSISNLDSRLAILVNRSSYSRSDVSSLVSSTYRSNPIICPVEPVAVIKMYSGSNSQRLYDIELRYGLDKETLFKQKEELSDLTLFTEEELKLSDFEKANVVYERLSRVEPGSGKTVYDSLVLNCANDEGVSLGYTALCREIGLKCCSVYGQKNLEDYCWNIVRIDGDYYHIDVANPPDATLLKSDREMWIIYRWDITQYPSCNGKPLYPEVEIFQENVFDMPAESDDTDATSSSSSEPLKSDP